MANKNLFIGLTGLLAGGAIGTLIQKIRIAKLEKEKAALEQTREELDIAVEQAKESALKAVDELRDTCLIAVETGELTFVDDLGIVHKINMYDPVAMDEAMSHPDWHIVFT